MYHSFNKYLLYETGYTEIKYGIQIFTSTLSQTVYNTVVRTMVGDYNVLR